MRRILGPKLDATAQLEAVLRSLPAWFGIEEALRMYARDSAVLPTFAIATGSEGQVAGFVLLAQQFPAAWEVRGLAVQAEVCGHGHGRALLAHAERWLVAKGVRWRQVRTIAAADPDAGYAQIRACYERLGFDSIEVHPTPCPPANPCLQMIKALR